MRWCALEIPRWNEASRALPACRSEASKLATRLESTANRRYELLRRASFEPGTIQSTYPDPSLEQTPVSIALIAKAPPNNQ